MIPVGLTTKKDWTGKQINYLTILEEAPNYAAEHNLKDKHIFWKCQCVCGNICYISSSRLTAGKVQSCGCKRKNQHDYTGQTIGRLTVIDENKEETYKHSYAYNPQGNRRTYWNCICNLCGTRTVRSSASLKVNNNQTICCENCRTVKDIRGQKHGKLTVIDFIGINKRHEALWKCQCDCGNTKILSNSLFYLVYSCGCLRMSIGELHIQKILDDNNIKYIYDQSNYFPDLMSAKGSSQCRYDFILLDIDDEPIRLVEFDGIQHTNPNVGWYKHTTIYNDKIKNEYALSHNIPLVRIPYTLRDTVTLEDIMGEKYLITKDNDKEIAIEEYKKELEHTPNYLNSAGGK